MSGRQPVLVMIQGSEPGVINRLPENRVTTIGRSTRNSVRVVSSSVSRFHCELSYVNGHWELHDLNSKKGTLVNGERVLESRILNPGDIIRLSTTVFRFDMIDESLDQDEALLAIKEAELDLRLTRQTTEGEWMDGVMARNRMESKDLQETGEEVAYSLKASLIFLGAVVVLVAVGVVVALQVMDARTPAARAGGRSDGGAAAAYAQGQAALSAGRMLEGLKALQQVERDYPQSAEARQAAQRLQEVRGRVLDQELRRLAEMAAQGDYAGAMRVREELGTLGLGPAGEGILSDQDEYLRRLARVAYTTMEKSARRRLDQGDRQGALEVYRRMRDSVGIPELSDEAASKVRKLDGAG